MITTGMRPLKLRVKVTLCQVVEFAWPEIAILRDSKFTLTGFV